MSSLNNAKYLHFSEVAHLQRGVRVVRNQLSEDGQYPVYQNSLSPLGHFDKYNNPPGKTFVICAGAAGDIGFSETNFWAADDCFVINCNANYLIDRFAYYVLLNNQAKLKSQVRKASVPRLSHSVIEQLIIPVPPIEIQREIVRILDSFTELTAELIAELTAELTARKKQYTYYRDKLLSFEKLSEEEKEKLGVRKVFLNDVVEKIFSGKCKNKDPSGKYNIYGSTGIIGKTNTPAYNNRNILVARVGANAGFVHVAEGEYEVSDNTLILCPNPAVEFDYLYYLLISLNLNQIANGAGQPLVTASQLKQIPLFLPPLDKQKQIVEWIKGLKVSLELCNALSAEIDCRQKQYTYYRDKVLSFPEQSA